MGGGAWPFLVGGVICLVNSVNERDLVLLNRPGNLSGLTDLSKVRLPGPMTFGSWAFGGRLLGGVIASGVASVVQEHFVSVSVSSSVVIQGAS